MLTLRLTQFNHSTDRSLRVTGQFPVFWVLAYPEKVLTEYHRVGVKFEETTYERA